MSYLNLDIDFFDHPKTRRLVGLLGKGAEIYPIRLWAYCGKFHAEDGKFKGYSYQEIESLCGWEGATETLIDAMLKVGFIDLRKGVVTVHEWLEHEGHICSFKQRAKEAAKIRWGKLRSKNATSNAKNETSNTPTLPHLSDHTLPNQTLPKREDHTRPSLDEVRKFLREKGYPISVADTFYNHYEANGWLIGGVPIQKWRSAVLKWCGNAKLIPNKPETSREDQKKAKLDREKFNQELEQNTPEFQAKMAELKEKIDGPKSLAATG